MNEPESNKVYMLKKCGRCKNPCKICFQSVTKRNGIQCQGACKKWVHFNCLGFTPGKIQDIKAGLIIIVCPCPDCSSEPKEILKNPRTTCPETIYPANKFPKCESLECPKNKSDGSFSSSFDCECVNPLSPTTQKRLNSRAKPLKSVPNPSQPLAFPKKGQEIPAKLSKSCSCLSAGSNSNIECGNYGCKCGSRKPLSQNQQCSGSFSSDSQLCERASMGHSMVNTLEQMCKTVTNLSEQIRNIMCRFGPK